jgi:MFS family permease
VKQRSAFADSLALLFTPRFGTFWFACLLSNIGTWAQQMAQPWLLLSLGASSLLIGLDSFAMSAPLWLLTFIGGALADRGDRRRVITTFQSIQMFCPIVVVILLLFGIIEPWMIIVLSLIVGITDALSMPSFQSIVPTIVEHEQIGSALALNSTQFNLSRILGPTLAGVLMASIGAIGCFAANAASYVPFLLVAVWILPPGASMPANVRPPEKGHLLAGLADITRDPNLQGALLTVFVTSLLCGPLLTFCPVLVKEAFHGDATQFSIALGAFGIGGLLGALALLGIDPGRDRRRISSWFALCYGAIVLFAGLDPWLWVLPALLAGAGLAMTVSNTSANTLLQATAPAHLLGRTVSLHMLAIRGGVSLGSLITGASAHVFGVRQALTINGALALAALIVMHRAWLRPVPQTNYGERLQDGD